MKRSSGVLMNISSLPGPYGIGTLGRDARAFADFIASLGFSVWQVLPLGTLDRGWSPYASDGAFACNPLYIDPDTLFEEGLLSRSEKEACLYKGSPYTVDYQSVSESRKAMLKSAYDRAPASVLNAARDFAKECGWLPGYALYRAVREKHASLIPYETAVKNKGDYEALADRVIFEQYLFYKEWASFKAYANAAGIEILGDIPVYLAPNGFEAWAHPELFLLDERQNPAMVAGVPPDYFSEDGQLWGNPIYDWKAMKKNGYAFWVERMERALTLYDRVRIDHFRGLASYWAVPAEAKSAKEGHWEEGPGMGLFESLFKKIPNPKIIAEDLGAYGEDVVKLLKDSGFPGMRVIQFGFLGGESSHLPHNYPAGCVAYTGTHDNNTLLGWLWELTPEERKMLLDYVGYKGDDWSKGGYDAPCVRAVIEAVWRSHAGTAILPFQDMCGFGKDTRMNIPGVPELNWRYRATDEVIGGIDKDYFRNINSLFGRI